MTRSRLVLILSIAALIAAFFAFGLQRYFSLEFIKAQQASIEGWYRSHPWQTALLYFLVYVAVTGLSLPGATILTLIGGAVFDPPSAHPILVLGSGSV